MATSAARVSSTLTLARSGVIEHAPDVGDDVGELGLEAVGKVAAGVEAGNAGDEEQVADACGEGERRGFDAGGWEEVLDGGHGAHSSEVGCSQHQLSDMRVFCQPRISLRSSRLRLLNRLSPATKSRLQCPPPCISISGSCSACINGFLDYRELEGVQAGCSAA